MRSPHTSYRWRGESQEQSSVWGLLGGHDWQGPVVGIWPGHGVTPYSLREVPWDFNDHESHMVEYGGRCEAHMGKCSQKGTKRLCFKVRTDDICTKLNELLMYVKSIKSLIWSLKVNTAVLHNEPTLSSWVSPTLLLQHKSIHQISGLLHALWRCIYNFLLMTNKMRNTLKGTHQSQDAL